MLRASTVIASVLVFLVAGVSADTVVLTGGKRVTGKVTTGPEFVTVMSSAGIVRIPRWRVARVAGEKDEAAEQPAGEAPAAAAAEGGEAAQASAGPVASPRPAKPAAAPAAPTRTGAPGRGAPDVAEVLSRKVTVDFQGTSLVDVLVYFRELTGINMAIHRDVLLETEPVYITAEDVTVETVLDLAFEDRAVGYRVIGGSVLFAYGRDGAQQYDLRFYPVADLLISTEDRRNGTAAGATSGRGGLGGGGGGGGGGTGGTRGGGGLPQFAVPQAMPGVVGVGGAAGAVPGGATRGVGAQPRSAMQARAQNLILLIKNTCGRGTWADPTGSGLIDTRG